MTRFSAGNQGELPAKLEAEANKLDVEARKLEAEVRKFEQTAFIDAVKMALAVFAAILAALKVADALGWIWEGDRVLQNA